MPSARAAAGRAEELQELLDQPERQTRQQMTGRSHMGSKDTEENGEAPRGNGWLPMGAGMSKVSSK